MSLSSMRSRTAKLWVLNLEHKFIAQLQSQYTFREGNSASGIDIPSLDLDIKVTSIRQPQSSCPFKSARQKIYGLGYHLIIYCL